MNFIRKMFHKCTEGSMKWKSRELIEVVREVSYTQGFATDLVLINIYIYTGTCLKCGRESWSRVRIAKDMDYEQPFDTTK